MRKAADWPTKTVTVVVPFAAGGNTDVMARMASSHLSTALKQTFVVENRVGAAGAIAAAYVAQAAPDGYTLLFGAAPQIAVVPTIQKVNYDPLKDLVPVSVFGTGPFILAINAAIPAKTMQEFVAYGKGKKLNYGSGGTGSIGHLSGALFVARAGLDSVHVPFKGGGPAMTALVGGQIDMYFGNASETHPAGGERQGPHPRRRHRQAHAAASGRADDQRAVSEFRAQFLERLPGAGEDAAGDRRQARAAGDRGRARSGDRRAAYKLGIEANGTTPQEFVAQIAREQPQFDAAIKAANMTP